MLGLELRAPLILSLSRHQKTSLAVVVLSFCRVASPESFKPWHSLIIEVVSDIPYDALDLISRLLACDMQFRRTFFTKSGSSAVARSLATSFAVQVHPFTRIMCKFLIPQTISESRQICLDYQRNAVFTVLSHFHSVLCFCSSRVRSDFVVELFVSALPCF
jgi:hypothetical protein